MITDKMTETTALDGLCMINTAVGTVTEEEQYDCRGLKPISLVSKAQIYTYI